MLTIDGAEGGGQLLRTALSLSIVTETPFRIDDIRGNRPNPGLKPQHLTSVEVAAELCEAELSGAKLDSESLTFRPGNARQSTLRADIGTAGSITLLFDTVLPVAVAHDEPFQLTATGGTDVKWSPPIGYYRLVKRPLLAEAGIEADVELAETGFYPAGGGEATLRITPSELSPFDLETRGDLERVEIYSKAAAELEDRDVADRQADHAQEELADRDVPAEIRSVEYVQTRSKGSSLLLRGVYEHTLAGFDSLGEPGRASEEVADDAVQQFTAFHASGAAVDRFMADQSMIVLALTGGRIRIPEVTDHVETNLDLINVFGSDVDLKAEADGTYTLTGSAHPAVR